MSDEVQSCEEDRSGCDALMVELCQHRAKGFALNTKLLALPNHTAHYVTLAFLEIG